MPESLTVKLRIDADGQAVVTAAKLSAQAIADLRRAAEGGATTARDTTRATEGLAAADRELTGSARDASAASDALAGAENRQGASALVSAGQTRDKARATDREGASATGASAATDTLAGSEAKHGAAARDAARDTRQLADETDRAGKTFLQAHGHHLKYIFGIGLLEGTRRGARSILQTADAYTELDNRLRLVTDSELQLIGVREALLDLSLRTRTTLEGNATIYSRLSLAARDYDYSQRQLLQVTELLNKQIAIGGSNSIEGEQGLRQLAQGLASGRLQGDELRSVLENLQGVSEGLIVGFRKLGKEASGGVEVTRQNIRQLAADGILTPQRILDAILASADDTEAKFRQVDVTISGAMTNMATAVKSYIAELDEAHDVSRDLADAINDIALGNLADGASKVDQALGIFNETVGFLAALLAGRYLASLGLATKAQSALTGATSAYAASSLTAAQATRVIGVFLQHGAQRATLYAAGMRAATVATRGLAFAARGLTAALGGPWGLLLLGVYALYEWVDSANDAAEAANSFQGALKALREEQAAAGQTPLPDEFISDFQRRIDKRVASESALGSIGLETTGRQELDEAVVDAVQARRFVDDQRQTLQDLEDDLARARETVTRKVQIGYGATWDVTGTRGSAEEIAGIEREIADGRRQLAAATDEMVQAEDRVVAVEERLGAVRSRITPGNREIISQVRNENTELEKMLAARESLQTQLTSLADGASGKDYPALGLPSSERQQEILAVWRGAGLDSLADQMAARWQQAGNDIDEVTTALANVDKEIDGFRQKEAARHQGVLAGLRSEAERIKALHKQREESITALAAQEAASGGIDQAEADRLRQENDTQRDRALAKIPNATADILKLTAANDELAGTIGMSRLEIEKRARSAELDLQLRDAYKDATEEEIVALKELHLENDELIRQQQLLADIRERYGRRAIEDINAEREAIEQLRQARQLTDAQAAGAQARLNIEEDGGSFKDGFIAETAEMVDAWDTALSDMGSRYAQVFGPDGQVIQGIADAAGRAAVFGDDFKDAMDNVARQAAAGLLSELIKIGIQFLLFEVLLKNFGSRDDGAEEKQQQAAAYVTEVTGQAGAQVALAALNAYASTAAIPITGPAAAPAAAAAALSAAAPYAALAVAGATLASGATLAARQGAIIEGRSSFGFDRELRPGLAGEAGVEAIFPLARGADGNLGIRADLPVGDGGGDTVNVGETTVNITVNGSVDNDAIERMTRNFRRTMFEVAETAIAHHRRPGAALDDGED